MYKILIVDASDSDRRLMFGLLTRAGYEPVIAEHAWWMNIEVKAWPASANQRDSTGINCPNFSY